MSSPGGGETGFANDTGTAAGRSFSEWLRTRAEPLWDAMQEHRFVRDMAANSMPPEVLRRYLIYERDFVEVAVTIFGYALVKAPSIAEQVQLAEVLRGLTSDQLDYFDRVFERLGVTEAECYPRVLPAKVLAFREGMLSLAAHRSYEEIIGGMTAAEWMYHTWCQRAQTQQPADPIAAEWIDLHVAAPFAKQVAWLRNQLDEHGPALAPWRQERIATAFRRTLALEIEFHEAPYQDAASSADADNGGK